MKTVTKDKKSGTSKEEMEALAEYCAEHPIFEESTRAAIKAISSLDQLPVPKELQGLLKK